MRNQKNPFRHLSFLLMCLKMPQINIIHLGGLVRTLHFQSNSWGGGGSEKKEFSVHVPHLSIKIKAEVEFFGKIRLCCTPCPHKSFPALLLMTESRSETPGSSKVCTAAATPSLPPDLPLRSPGRYQGARDSKTHQGMSGVFLGAPSDCPGQIMLKQK